MWRADRRALLVGCTGETAAGLGAPKRRGVEKFDKLGHSVKFSVSTPAVGVWCIGERVSEEVLNIC
jgi:hypothetical protein